MIESTRRLVRGILGYDSFAYRLGSQILIAAEITRREGLARALQIHRLERADATGETAIALATLAHPIRVRNGTPDIATIINNVIREEYGQYWGTTKPLRMIDAGAYIGDTSAYFLSRFPGMQVIALEPNAANYRMAKENLAPYGDSVTLINAALADSKGQVRMSGDFDGAAIRDDGDFVDATTVIDVMEQVGWDRLDLLKMDIEGAEAQVLGTRADAWLPRVDRVILEPHGAAIEAAVRATLTRNGFAIERYRSILYAVRNRGDV